MSIIVKKDGKIVLYCKGADSKVQERLDSSEKEIMTQTDKHLNVKMNVCFLFYFYYLIEICE
jgi:magnesium-transporting ATPase (P-type)